jgi:hypothetical protein
VVAGNHLVFEDNFGNFSTIISEHQEEMVRARVMPGGGASGAFGAGLGKNMHNRGELFQN